MATKFQVTDTSLDIDGVRHGARALVLKPVLKPSRRTPEAMLEEAVSLAQAIGLEVVEASHFNLPNPTPGELFGKGHVENWASVVQDKKIHLTIIDHPLTPIQQRNLERAWKCKVIDRTGLILEIFGARARTREGQLQVELAALNYQKSRLVRSWTHLERQRGGFGFLGGPGESQLEIDRRLISGRITKLKEELEQVRRTRGLQREARHRAEHPTIALVGYTNAGKSTLFNRLTGADVFAKDLLFATLDTSMRGMTLPSGRKVIVSDTVGFIADLPTHLVEAFRATLEEVQQADVILHVRDVSNEETRAQKESVEAILSDLGIGQDDERLIEVLNKSDLLPEDERNRMREYAVRTSWDAKNALPIDGLNQEARGGSVVVSALSGNGIDELLRLFDEHLSKRSMVYEIQLPLSDGAALAWLYEHGEVLERKDKGQKTRLKITLDAADFNRFNRRFVEHSNVKV